MNLRKINRITHRDLGYVFFAMSIIYGLSGISLNHLNDWNPNYIIENRGVYSTLTEKNGIHNESVLAFLETLGEKENYKKHYFPNSRQLKIFINNGSVVIDLKTGEGIIEKLTRRPIFYQCNWLHYNHAKRLYTYFADIYAIALILLATTGLFMVKGKNGLKERGVWLAIPGLLIPMALYLIYTQ